MDKIDLVIPYVDSSDTEWQALFNKYNPQKTSEAVNGKNRFRGQGDFFKYFFRCIEANMPWINNIFLLVQSKSQVPSWINKDKVKIVTHDMFIPKQYLPTFNSCTIEMFLWNIPGLGEKFIYFNDDIYIIHPTKPEDFFSDKCANVFYKTKLNSMYGNHCRNGYNLVFNENIQPGGLYFTMNHTPRSYLRSKMHDCYNLYKSQINNSISAFRETKNMNCYIYAFYLLKNKYTTDSKLSYGYYDDKSISKFEPQIDYKHTICLNDTSDTIDIYNDPIIKKWFSTNYEYPCKYEINYDPKYVNKSPEIKVLKHSKLNVDMYVRYVESLKKNNIDDGVDTISNWM